MAGSYDGSVRRYRPSDCKAFPPTPSHDGPIKAIAVGDGTSAFPVMRTVWTKVWSEPVQSNHPLLPLAIMCSTGFVVTGGKDRTIRAWAPPSSPSSDLHCTALLTGHEASVECLSARHDDGTVSHYAGTDCGC